MPLQKKDKLFNLGKVLDWSSLKFKFFDLKKIRVFVLDEADVMIGIQGHQDQSIRIHQHLPTGETHAKQ